MKSEKSGVKLKQENETVKIGRKPAVHYILATMTLFSQGAKSVMLQARGNAISTAVNVQQAVARKLKLQEPVVKLGTVELEDKEKKRMQRVSTAEIELKLA